MAAKYKVIEHESCERDYGMRGTIAIIELLTDGSRYLLTDGYCGERSIEGGCVRWSGGAIYKLLPTDTLESLTHVPEDGWPGVAEPQCWDSIYSWVVLHRDEHRPWLDWPGHAIETLAVSLGL